MQTFTTLADVVRWPMPAPVVSSQKTKWLLINDKYSADCYEQHETVHYWEDGRQCMNGGDGATALKTNQNATDQGATIMHTRLP